MKYKRLGVILLYVVFVHAYDGYLELVPSDDEHNESESHLALWTTGYMRSADKAHAANGGCKEPLSTLLFGQACFPLRDAFADSIVIAPSNIWVNLATICPVVEYSEKGVQIGMEYAHDALVRDHPMRFGIRGLVPIKSVCMARRYTSQDAESEISGINQVRCLSTEVVTGPEGHATIDESYAYRLDFLSSLSLADNKEIPFISYSSVPLRMNGTAIDVTFNNSSPIHLIRRSDGRVPYTPFTAVQTDVLATPELPADGSAVVGDNERCQFADWYSYEPLALRMDNQAQYWLVPTVVWDSNNETYNLNGYASDLRGVVENLVQYQIDSSILDYLTDTHIDLNTQTCRGLGDIDTQLFALWSWPSSMTWTELNCSFIFPTGKKVYNPLILLAQPLGNNGHMEIGPGLEVGGYLTNWCSLRGEASYLWALRARENVAAAFQGATVKNVGPCVPAFISWRYFNFTFDFNITEPMQHQFGINLAYNLYYKHRDSVTFTTTTANDFEGHEQTLDPCLLSRYTNIVSNKLLGELFWSTSIGAIYGGFSYVVRGKNVPLESMAYLGFDIEF
jgi:hypothetical protein